MKVNLLHESGVPSNEQYNPTFWEELMVFYLQKVKKSEPPVAICSHVEVFCWVKEGIP
jgi:hypothetical protein